MLQAEGGCDDAAACAWLGSQTAREGVWLRATWFGGTFEQVARRRTESLCANRFLKDWTTGCASAPSRTLVMLDIVRQELASIALGLLAYAAEAFDILK